MGTPGVAADHEQLSAHDTAGGCPPGGGHWGFGTPGVGDRVVHLDNVEVRAAGALPAHGVQFATDHAHRGLIPGGGHGSPTGPGVRGGVVDFEYVGRLVDVVIMVGANEAAQHVQLSVDA